MASPPRAADGHAADARPFGDGLEAGECGLTPASFAEQLARHARRLWVVAAAWVGRRDIAEDVLQEAAVIALGRLDQFAPGTSFPAWMAQIVRFAAQNRARAERRVGAESLPELPALAARGDGPAPPVATNGALMSDQQAFDDGVVRALEDLGDVPRACLLLRVVLDLPVREVAQTLGIPDNTVVSHVHRARERMRARLTGHPFARRGTR